MRLAVLLVAAALAVPVPAAAQNLQGRVEAILLRLEDVVGQSFARSLPLPSASAGVSYSFDPATGNFQRDPVTFGQVFVDRAQTLGKGRLNLSFAYQFVRLDEISGEPADDLTDTTPIPFRGLLAAFEFTNLDAQADVHQFLFAGTYGITDDLEASIALPLVYSSLFTRARLRAAGISTDGDLVRANADVSDSSGPVGIGDILLRAKYRLLDRQTIDVAAGLLLRIPTGDVDDLQGTGFTEVAPTLFVSTRRFEPRKWARLQGHLNAGAGLNADDVDSSEIRWSLGLDWGVTENTTASLAFLARHQLARVAPPGFFNFARCRGGLVACASDPSLRNVGSQPLFGLSGDRPDYYDLSIGGRGAIWRDTVFAFANLVVPLNDGFVRTDPIPLVGVEATF